MPPQPIDKVRRGASYQLHVDFISKHPALGVAVSESIIRWTSVEQALGFLFVSLLKANEQRGAELYAAFEGASAKRAAMHALCISSTTADEADLIFRLLKFVTSKQKTRDKLAHWLFGSSQEIPDSLILIDPKLTWAAAGGTLSDLRQYPIDADISAFAARQIDRENVYAYRLEDILQDALDFTKLTALILRFTQLVSCEKDHPERPVLFDELDRDARLAKPAIR